MKEITMRPLPIALLCAALLLASCADDETPESAGPTDEPADDVGAMARRPNAGGSTRDFGGNCAPCREQPERIEVAWDEDGVVGFSPEQTLARVEGAYVNEALWRDPCAEGECAHDSDCPREPAGIAGTQTELRLVIERSGTQATVERCHDGRGTARDASQLEQAAARECPADYMHIPVTVTLRTTDDMLDERIETEIITAHADDALGIGGDLLDAADVEGQLATALPSLGSVEWSAWFDSKRGLSLYALTAPSSPELYDGAVLARLTAAPPSDCDDIELTPAD
jgi:hypothetical protein